MPTKKFCAVLLALSLLWACTESPSGAIHGSPAPTLAPAPPAQNILVIGGTSGVGLATVELALARGHSVTALARRPERMSLSHAGLNTVAGDILDSATMDSSIAGQDAIVIAIGMGPTRGDVTLFSEGTANVLAAMKRGGVTRLVAVTGIGAGDTRGHGGFFYDKVLQPLALNTIYRDKDRMEALIQNSSPPDLAWTIVRPGFLTDDPARQAYRVISDLDGVTAGDIPRADVAHFVIAAIENVDYIGAHPLISE